MREEEHYHMNYYCSNCHRSFMQVFKFGERAHQGECPHCGVEPIDERRFDYEKIY